MTNFTDFTLNSSDVIKIIQTLYSNNYWLHKKQRQSLQEEMKTFIFPTASV